MKQLIFALIFSITAVSFADKIQPNESLEYIVKSASFSPDHIKNAGPATLSLDYANSKIKMSVAIICPKGSVCPQVARILVVELPITKVDTNSCGVRFVTASKDLRPADGSLQLIEVTDVTNMNCGAFEAGATYKTSYVDRRSGKSVDSVSTMTLNLVSNEKANVLLKFRQGSGFSPNPSTLIISVDSSGKVSSVQTFHSTGEVKNVEVAKLSEASLKLLKERVKSIPAEVKLVDEQEGQPKCTDAPDTTISATVNNQDVVIYRWSSCHTYQSYEGEATTLAAVMKGFVNLIR